MHPRAKVSQGVNRNGAPKTTLNEVEWPLDVRFSCWSGDTKNLHQKPALRQNKSQTIKDTKMFVFGQIVVLYKTYQIV